jgi:hypothetical protein
MDDHHSVLIVQNIYLVCWRYMVLVYMFLSVSEDRTLISLSLSLSLSLTLSFTQHTSMGRLLEQIVLCARPVRLPCLLVLRASYMILPSRLLVNRNTQTCIYT